MEIDALISEFATEVGSGQIEIYNEFSLQHELGIYLRKSLKNKKVQFERNVTFFGLNKSDYVKREIDISIFESDSSSLEAVIELKFPRNGQYPEQMFSFCKDVQFAEQLKKAGFQEAYVVIFAEDSPFYQGKTNGIYGFFRGGRDLTGEIQKPTGARNDTARINGRYSVKWHAVTGSLKYAVIRVE